MPMPPVRRVEYDFLTDYGSIYLEQVTHICIQGVASQRVAGMTAYGFIVKAYISRRHTMPSSPNPVLR